MKARIFVVGIKPNKMKNTHTKHRMWPKYFFLKSGLFFLSKKIIHSLI